MSVLSPGVQLAWHIAATEAAVGRYDFIEREHLFIGLCKVPNQQADAGSKRDPEQAAALKAETMAIESLFLEQGLDRIELYRAVRQRLGKGKADTHKHDRLGRSVGSKTAFEQAQKLALGVTSVNVLHLMAALLEPEGTIDGLLEERGKKIASIKGAA